MEWRPSAESCMKESFQRKSEFPAASIGHFRKDEGGQDFLEYTLLMAFVALFSANNTLSMAAR